MIAKKLPPPNRRRVREGQSRAGGRRREPPQPRPTRSRSGEVRWWEREPPEDSDEALWEAVKRVQAKRLAAGLSVSALARRLGSTGRPIRRETLSRVLNGRQPTTWETVERLAAAVGVDLDEGEGGPGEARGPPPAGADGDWAGPLPVPPVMWTTYRTRCDLA